MRVVAEHEDVVGVDETDGAAARFLRLLDGEIHGHHRAVMAERQVPVDLGESGAFLDHLRLRSAIDLSPLEPRQYGVKMVEALHRMTPEVRLQVPVARDLGRFSVGPGGH